MTKTKSKAISNDVYEVFARVDGYDSLSHLGCVHAPNDELAKAQGRMTYSERDWSELVVVKREHLLPVISNNNSNVVGFA